MKHPDKWRETTNPFSLPFKNFKLVEILGYPHARNDVFHVLGIYEGEEVEAYIKIARQKDSDLKTEIDTILKLDYDFIPQILDYDDDREFFVVTRAKQGDRLSFVLKNNPSENSLDYMYEYGHTLAKIHSQKGEFPKVKDRKFFHIPQKQVLDNFEIGFIYDFLIENSPKTVNSCFCHGDFHYANVLWQDKSISAVLDFELAGLGNREFDIAWAIINRPGQEFLNSQEEIDLFLKGYSSICPFDLDCVKYYMALVYTYFFEIGKNNIDYKTYVLSVLKKLCNKE